MNMFCYQCEQTAKGTGCTAFGVCGKDPETAALQDLLVYALKDISRYAHRARELGRTDKQVNVFTVEALFSTLTNVNFSPERFCELIKEAAQIQDKAKAMYNDACKDSRRAPEQLDCEIDWRQNATAHTETYGHPEPTHVRITPVKGKCVLVSGHDLKDLEELLKQTEGKVINVYTHGEMLPCNAYPGLKKYKHLVGNYGGAWQDQRKEFDEFPGAILMTTNCLQKPKDSYKDRIFTSGVAGWPGVVHICDRDFAPVIGAALAEPGFAEDAPEKLITVGFARNAVMSVADKVVEAVKAGKIRRFFLIGGCDGAKPGRNYYTEFAQKVPKDCVILTLACGKYRFNKLHFGQIDGIPRLLDCGQCNDAYSAIQIAVALAKAFDCGVNDLPLSMILSWYEQKAVAILLTLLHLGIKNMKLGPSLPAFTTPNVLKVLVEKFNISPVADAEKDLAAALS